MTLGGKGGGNRLSYPHNLYLFFLLVVHLRVRFQYMPVLVPNLEAYDGFLKLGPQPPSGVH